MIDYNSLTKEELIELLNEKDEILIKENKSLKRSIKYRDHRIEKLEAENKNLHIKIEELIAKYEDKLLASKLHLVEQFIPKSEKLTDEDLIINELEVIREKKARRSPTQNFINDLKGLYSKQIIIDYDFESNNIDRNSVKPFGNDETYKIEYKPSSFEVVRIVKNKYRDKDKIYEEVYDDPFPHSPLTPSLAANLIEMKFDLGVPFYRYSNYLNNNGLNISDIDIYNYAKRTMDLLEPLYKQLLIKLVNTPYKVIHADETPLKVINSNKDRCYVFVYTTSFWDDPVYIYDFNDSRSIDKTKELLKDYKGYLVCDGYPGYDSLTDMGITLQRCMVHSRRYFMDVLKVLDEESKKKSPAYKVITLMDKLFEKEAEFRKRKLTAKNIKKERSYKSYQSIIDELNGYIDSIDISNNELLSKAVNYYLNHKKELYTYLEDGYIDFSNNIAERAVKPFVIARKNFLFCKSADGAITTGKLFSLIQTAKANHLKSELYLTYVITNINKKDIEDLLPWSDKLPKELSIST